MGGRLEAWFVAAKFREAAEVLKTERIKLPADANLELDDKLFPPPCLAKLNRGRNVQEVAEAPQGRTSWRRIDGGRRCGNCNQPNQNATGIAPGLTGGIQNICFSKKLTDSLFREPSKQCELIFALLFLSTLSSNLPKMGKNAPNGRSHAPYFSLKNDRLLLNMINIGTSRAACVFTAFIFPKASESVVL